MPSLIRPMHSDDIPTVEELARTSFAIGSAAAVGPGEPERGWGLARTAHLLATDPAGAWVAEDAGVVVGHAMALLREGIWALSLLAVRRDRHGERLGRRLMDAALAYGADARGGLILSSEHPAAMRLYATSGFALRPTVSAAGIVDRGVLAPTPDVRAGGPGDFGWMDGVSRAVRGAGYGPDLGNALETSSRLLVIEGRGWTFVRQEEIRSLVARDDEAAAQLLNAGLASMSRGATASVDAIAAGNDWAVRACLRAGLALSPSGPFFTRGALGPLTPYLPSGAYL